LVIPVLESDQDQVAAEYAIRAAYLRELFGVSHFIYGLKQETFPLVGSVGGYAAGLTVRLSLVIA
jgi:hypothetical protein